MKISHLLLPALVPACILSSCFKPVTTDTETALLLLSLRDESATRASDDYEYTLRIRNSNGKTVFSCIWDYAPLAIELAAGDYTVDAYTEEFDLPLYDTPVFGDSRHISLQQGQIQETELVCSQINAGLTILPSESFIALYRDNPMYLRCTQGTLAYSFSETRTAYFLPGKIALLMGGDSGTRTIYTTELGASQMFTLRLTTSENVPLAVPVNGLGISLRTDTTRVWTENSYAYDGGDHSGDTPSNGYPSGAFGVNEARKLAGSTDVWVYGYIAGGDLTSSSCSFTAPFSSRTNLVLAASPGEKDRSKCMSVQLPQGDIRDALNLVDNPGLLGTSVYLRGDIVESYYKLPGLQKLSDYRK